ncbi:hypothetical protein KUV62_15720 [Salipiger bermudensis]|uniref:hypothetical protein n=1 Tax=Salipiger bermudensis TaxID=344736 RepID=UPI001C991395|nr:hypothetical protein [Salipiger bermudensis]MBY6005373.1 hypothetical protein [Salipiger bermudensis]
MAIGAAVGSIASGLIGSRSASKAADAQADAAEDSTELQREIYYNNIDLQKPWYDAGTNALAALNYELGLGANPNDIQPVISQTTTPAPQTAQSGTQGVWSPDTHPARYIARNFPLFQAAEKLRAATGRQPLFDSGPAAAQAATTTYSVGGKTYNTMGEAQRAANNAAGYEYQGFQETPGFQYALDQSQEAINRNAAARGMRLSGATLNALATDAQGRQNQEYNNWLNRIAGLAGQGQSSASQTAAYGTNYANQAGQNMMAAGQARASGYQGVNNALQGTFNNLGTIYGMSRAGYFG